MSEPLGLTKQLEVDTRVLDELSILLAGQPAQEPLRSVVKLLRKNSDHFEWVGIYLVKGGTLELAAYAGDAETEHLTIPVGQGICGSAAQEGRTIVVPDVNKDPRYLMCFASTRSEIVVPIKGTKGVLGEIDIDSDKLSAFTNWDKSLLEQIAARLAVFLEKLPAR